MIFQIVLLAILFLLVFTFSQKLIKPLVYSPYYLYITFNLITLIVTIFYYYYYEPKISLYLLDDKATNKEFLELIKYHLIHLNAFVFGGLVIHNFCPTAFRRKYLLHKFPITIKLKIPNPDAVLKYGMIMAISVLLLNVLISGTGFFVREEYLPKSDSRSLTLLAKLFSMAGAALLGVVHNKFPKKTDLYFILLVIVNLSTGSRFTFIVILMYLVLAFNGNKKSFKNNTLFVIKIFVSLFFLAYLIQLRSLYTHGLFPYVGYFFQSFDKIWEYFVFNIYYLLIFGNFVTIDTVDRGLVTWETISVSLNPLPGSLVGWYDYASKMRINIYCPYSSHGEVFSMGVYFTTLFYFVVGTVITYFDFSFRKLLYNGRLFMAMILLLLVALHLIYGFEYNLRSSVRYLYYAMFVLTLFYGIQLLWKSVRRKTIRTE
ncbi:MAG: hypothetical protein BM564_02255 [Bacteroidetes bacterium MedPE-SWsnd-G2]|nr:MAG: hypothetical protein BM564_02255 [Bacteroidetes bacterium MedPE-SWsnd-G2]